MAATYHSHGLGGKDRSATGRPARGEETELSRAVGEALRKTRQERGLTLHDVGVLSGGRFKPSALGGYERGERSISVGRFCSLAALYGVPPDRLLARTLEEASPVSRCELVIDLTKLPLIRGEEVHLVAEFIHRVRAQRGDYLSDVITLRSGDLEALALTTQLKPDALLDSLGPAIRAQVPSNRGTEPAGPIVILP
ncbi:MAG TPA: helix-turn-helix domain-containing protein [Actinomycetota bacterium]|nr:helix-turn-helix domain-containing protein [Actinomycetota bacterium]